MRQNVTFSIGNLAVIDKADAQLGFFREIFSGLEGKASSLIPSAKLLIYNRLGECLSLNRLAQFTPHELCELIGAKELFSERTLNRNLVRIGQKAQFIIGRYQQLIKKHGLVSNTQNIDFSSGYFVGEKCPMGKLGYSRDKMPGNLQITYGVCIGDNKIPTALTIQNGNVVDKEHFRSMLRLARIVLEPESLLVFDCGGNTAKNKEKILKLGFDYLTFRQKKVGPYKKLIKIFLEEKPVELIINEEEYLCVKVKEDDYKFVFFSEKLKRNQLRIKKSKFKKKLEKNDALLKKVKKGKEFKPQVSSEGWIVTKGCLQKTLDDIPNPFINGIEGYFILESSKDLAPEKALQMYKDKDVAEKLIRDMKEGAELHPMRHWNKDAVKGYLVIVFLTNALVNLTLYFAKNPLVKNLKLLKKYLKNSTLTVVYPKNRFRFKIVANISAEIRAFMGNFIEKYGDKELGLRW